ncbi:MAG: complex I subunit 5 family protein [Acidobacteriota bacterium]
MSTLAHLVNTLPGLPVAFPLVCAALLAGLRKALPRALTDALALTAAAADFTVCAWLLLLAHAHTIVYWFGNWYPRGSTVLGIDFVIDVTAAGLATLCSGLMLLALLFSWRYTDSGSDHFQPLMMVFLAGMCGFCLTGDLFNMFVFFELMSTAAFALTGLKTREPAPLQGAFNFAVTNTVAAFMVLTGIAFLYSVTGALNMAQIGLALTHRHDPVVLFACALITCGFFTKAAIVPFHFWLADAHAVSPTPVCVLFSGIMVELGLYAVLRLDAVIFVPAMDGKAAALRAVLVAFGAVTAILGGFMCYAEHHIKRLLAFSTISHAGLMLVAMALQGPLAAAGFLVYLAGHAFVKSSLFFVAGILLHRHRTASEPALFAKAKDQPLVGGLWFLGGLGLAGAPGFLTVYGDALTSHAAEPLGMEWVSYLFLVSGVLTGGAVFRAGMHAFLGWGGEPISDRAAEVDEKPETSGDDNRTPWYLVAPPTICLAAAIGVTFVPGIREQVLLAANRLWNQAGYLHEVYFRQMLVSPRPHAEMGASEAAMHGLIAVAGGLLLACTSVFRLRLRRMFRAGAFLEGPLWMLRLLQSGHIGDYVAWMTIGISVVGAAFLILLR